MERDILYVAVAIGVCFLAFWYAWWRPMQRVRRLLEQIAEGEAPKSCFIDSPRWFSDLERHLEKISGRFRLLNQALAEEKFNLQAIMTSMAEGVLVVDSRHVIHLVNGELIKLFHLKQSPLYRTVLEALREAEVELILRETFQTAQSISREVSLLAASVEKPVQVELHSVPIRSESGTIQGAVVIFHDVSRVKQLEGVRKEFVANVSHELRTPLSIFRGYLETLIDNPDLSSAEMKRIFETMSRHSNRLNALVEDLLTLARLESRREQLQPIPVKIDRFVAQVLQDYKSKIDAEGAEVVVRIPADLPMVDADPARLEQVLFNLLDNSLVYSKTPKRIEIEASRRDSDLVLSVRDNGIGIPPADLPRIFERFYRVDKARSREKGGTGLGLSIVKHIVQMHGGAVTAESEFGEWTQITIRLPIK